MLQQNITSPAPPTTTNSTNERSIGTVVVHYILVQPAGKMQRGRQYFSRREITALVGGPGNMAVYRHTLVYRFR